MHPSRNKVRDPSGTEEHCLTHFLGLKLYEAKTCEDPYVGTFYSDLRDNLEGSCVAYQVAA